MRRPSVARNSASEPEHAIAGLGRLDFLARAFMDQHVIQQALELAERPGPGIALVAHEGLRHRERALRAVLADMHDIAKEGGRAVEAARTR